jgi:hypothetical protein
MSDRAVRPCGVRLHPDNDETDGQALVASTADELAMFILSSRAIAAWRGVGAPETSWRCR